MPRFHAHAYLLIYLRKGDLFTKVKRYSIQDTPFSLPIVSGCAELNSLLKGILFEEGNEKDSVTFDFLINGTFLRSTIQEYVSQNKISTESVIEIEYVLREESPQLEQFLLHDDWVSSVDFSSNFILSGSYDNMVSIWNTQGKCISRMEGHMMAVKSVAWISYSQGEGSFLSASQDQSVLIWQFQSETDMCKCVHICRGHAGSVDCLAVQPSTLKFASGSWDKMIKIWETKVDVCAGDEDDDLKMAKKNRKDKKTDTITNRTPLATLSGHKEPVSSLAWLDDNELVSSGWDHCIHIWDVATATNKQTLTGNKVIMDISYSHYKKLLVSGSTDRFIRLWDPRVTDGKVVQSMLSSHNGWVSSVDWSPSNENHLISGSYDNSIKLWDIRSTACALYDLEKHNDKVMCVCWKNSDIILSGGADCHVYIHKQSVKANSEE